MSNELTDEDMDRPGYFVIYDDGATSCDYSDLWTAAKHAASIIKGPAAHIRWNHFLNLDERTLAEKLFRKFLELGRIDLRGLKSL